MDDGMHNTAQSRAVNGDQKTERPSHRVTKFMRDVLVNVLANLLAAAVIYLAGTAAGLIPSSPQLIAASISTILLVVFYGLVIISRFVNEHLRFRMTSIGMAICGPAVIAATFAGALDHEPFPRWFFYIFGVSATLSGVLMFHSIRQIDAKPRATEQKRPT